VSARLAEYQGYYKRGSALDAQKINFLGKASQTMSEPAGGCGTQPGHWEWAPCPSRALLRRRLGLTARMAPTAQLPHGAARAGYRLEYAPPSMGGYQLGYQLEDAVLTPIPNWLRLGPQLAPARLAGGRGGRAGQGGAGVGTRRQVAGKRLARRAKRFVTTVTWPERPIPSRSRDRATFVYSWLATPGRSGYNFGF